MTRNRRAVINDLATADGGNSWYVSIDLEEFYTGFFRRGWRVVASEFVGWNQINEGRIAKALKTWELTEGDLIR